MSKKIKHGFTLSFHHSITHHSKRGFTLIELLVVVLIVGILASLVIVNVNEARKSARDAKRVANLKSIQGALEMYNQKNGEYPKTISQTYLGADWVTTNFSNPPFTAPSFFRDGCENLDGGVGWCGMTSHYNGGEGQTKIFQSSGDMGWIPGLAPDFMPILPSDPKQADPINGYLYRSDGTDYMVIAHQTMETVGTDPSNSDNPVSIQEMDRRGHVQPSIAVFSSGAWDW